jgi:hypothetical protein
MKLFLEIVLTVGVVAWAVSKFYLQIDYGLVKAIVLLALICYAPMLISQPSKPGETSE